MSSQHRFASLFAAAAIALAPAPGAAAEEGVLNKEGYWRLAAADSVCHASIEVEGGATILFTAADGDITFAVGSPKRMRPGRRGVMATEAYAFDFVPKYGDDNDYIYVEDFLNDRALAALRLGRQLAFSVDGRRIAGVMLEGTGFEAALDAVAQCSLGQSGWWGKGVKSTHQADAKSAGGTGTGFFISADGVAVTAAHVVKDCGRLESPRWGAVKVLAADPRADLAILKAGSGSGQYVSLRGRGPKLGESMSAAGYPLGQMLGSGLKITTGVVSGLAGPQGDRGLFQLSAPIQPGNSGGPVIDAEGALIGVTSAKLDELKVADATGIFPQNVNFAVPVTILQSFLEENGVAYKVAGPAASGGGVSAAMPNYTFSLVCTP